VSLGLGAKFALLLANFDNFRLPWPNICYLGKSQAFEEAGMAVLEPRLLFHGLCTASYVQNKQKPPEWNKGITYKGLFCDENILNC
jgi:hypothetical protein